MEDALVEIKASAAMATAEDPTTEDEALSLPEMGRKAAWQSGRPRRPAREALLKAAICR
jgi:hypothetical protein